MGQWLLGIDVGTYSSKGVLSDQAGHVLKTHVIPHEVAHPRPGWAEQDADAVWWGDVVAICQTLLDGAPYQGSDVAAVGLSAMGPCLVALDDQDRPLRPAILYGIDTRSAAEIGWLNERYGREALFELGGMILTTQSVGPKILWMRRHEPELWARIAWVTSASSYLTFRMAGEKVIDRRTASHFTPLIDIWTLEWSDRFADEIIDPGKLPRLAWSTELAGQVTPQAAAQTGLPAGMPVTVGNIDGLSEAFSVGVVQPGDLMIMYGSTSFFNLVLDHPLPGRRTWLTGGAFPGSYFLGAGMATTGAITRWFLDQLAQNLDPEQGFGVLFEQASQIEPGAGGLIVLPYFSGERSPIYDPLARGVVAGLTLSHTRAHLFRAVLEGIAYGVRHNLETIRATGAEIRRVVAVGGGTRHPLGAQIVSDVAGITQTLPALTIGASYGDAFLAGMASGLLALDDLAQWVQPGRTITPQAAHRARYDALYPHYLALYQQTRDIVHALSQG